MKLQVTYIATIGADNHHIGVIRVDNYVEINIRDWDDTAIVRLTPDEVKELIQALRAALEEPAA